MLLPLFPLATVLFPGLVLPLHIFEPRYRDLVQALVDLPDDSPREFGVIAVRPGADVARDGERAMHPVGCTAALREVTAYPDGRFDIVTTGTTRFRLLHLDQTPGHSYLTGVVEPLAEPDKDTGTAALALRVGARFASYRQRLGLELPALPADPGVLSYLVAAAMVLELTEQQGLLEQVDVAARLHTELTLLRREIAMIDALRSLPALDLAREEWNPN